MQNPSSLIIRQLWISNDLKTTLHITIKELSEFSHCWSKFCYQVSQTFPIPLPTFQNESTYFQTFYFSITMLLLLPFLVGAASAQVLAHLVWREKSNWSKILLDTVENVSPQQAYHQPFYPKDTYSCPDGWHISDIGDEVTFIIKR